MGCVASKIGEEEEVVSICRERKKQLKLAVERRYALAEAHCRYCQALFAVSAAIKLFVARHSSPSSPFLITFEKDSSCSGSDSGPSHQTGQNVINNPMFKDSNSCCDIGNNNKSSHPAIACDECECECGDSSSDASSDESCEESREEVVREQLEEQQQQQHQQQLQHQYLQQHNQYLQQQHQYLQQQHQYLQQQQHYGYYYMQMPVQQQADFGWDFFNTFDGMRPHHEVMQSYQKCCDDEFRAVREEEGIPDLEEVEESEGRSRQENVVKLQEEQKVEKVVTVENNVGESEGNVVNVVAGGGDNVNQGDIKPKGLNVIDTPEQGRELLEALQDIEDYFIRASDSGKDVSRMLEVNRVHLQSNLEEIKGGKSFSFTFVSDLTLLERFEFSIVFEIVVFLVRYMLDLSLIIFCVY